MDCRPPPPPSFPRKRESTPGPSPRRGKPGFWIPAYAGMTVGARNDGGRCGMMSGMSGHWRQPPKPSPSGRGLGEGESLCAAQPHTTDDAARKKPPFRKRGVGGILYLQLYIHLHLHSPRTAANLMRKQNAISGLGIGGDAAWCESGAGEIPPTPLLRKGGF